MLLWEGVLHNDTTVAAREIFPGRGGGSAHERGGDACRKFWSKPLKETNLGVAQAFFYP